MAPHVGQQGGVAQAAGPGLGEHQEEAAAHREVGRENVNNGNYGDQQAAAGGQGIPYRIVHDRTPFRPGQTRRSM